MHALMLKFYCLPVIVVLHWQVRFKVESGQWAGVIVSSVHTSFVVGPWQWHHDGRPCHSTRDTPTLKGLGGLSNTGSPLSGCLLARLLAETPPVWEGSAEV